jgi:S-adenosylmethionine hydrolase
VERKLVTFDVFSAARTMETVYHMPVGFHVCVVDPGVGTKRRAIIVKTKRGDYFVGPDNGCLMTAPRLLGGIEKVVEMTNEKYMVTPISPIFHGRHVFAPGAAHLSKGVPMEDFGKELRPEECVNAPYDEAVVENDVIEAVVIHANSFGSIHLNILHSEWDKLGVNVGENVELDYGKGKMTLPVVTTFGEVKIGEPLIMKDDYNRIEIAVNQGYFNEKAGLKAGGKVVIRRV